MRQSPIIGQSCENISGRLSLSDINKNSVFDNHGLLHPPRESGFAVPTPEEESFSSEVFVGYYNINAV